MGANMKMAKLKDVTRQPNGFTTSIPEFGKQPTQSWVLIDCLQFPLNNDGFS